MHSARRRLGDYRQNQHEPCTRNTDQANQRMDNKHDRQKERRK